MDHRDTNCCALVGYWHWVWRPVQRPKEPSIQPTFAIRRRYRLYSTTQISLFQSVCCRRKECRLHVSRSSSILVSTLQREVCTSSSLSSLPAFVFYYSLFYLISCREQMTWNHIYISQIPPTKQAKKKIVSKLINKAIVLTIWHWEGISVW